MTAEQLIKIVRKKGSDADDVRDAAHEATHGLQTRLRKPWTRDNLHAAIERLAEREADDTDRTNLRSLPSAFLVRYELQARAVEMLACQHFKIDYDISHWALMCWMETAKGVRIDLGSIDELAESFRAMAKQRRTKDLFNRLLRLRTT